ncbi:MAG TPA: Do family serine endopeptidase [Micropepsaceae bacterium]|nr:Do family serine endopeptidase [Micropepsaceae bacterium]
MTPSEFDHVPTKENDAIAPAPAHASRNSSFLRGLLLGASAIGLVAIGALAPRLLDSEPAIAVDTTPPATVSAAGSAVVTPLAGTAIGPSAYPMTFADVVDRVAPAVVSVRAEVTPTVANFEMNGDPRLQPFMDRFRDRYGERFNNVPRGGRGRNPEPERGPQGISMGSGFIVDKDGFIVTNNHVIEGATKITVILSDGREVAATLVGRDEATDIALLKADAGEELPYVEFADDTQVRVGDWVVAVGNPFGLDGTVTAGIVSARSRDIGNGPYTDFFQIDASINRGNSGGPAFDLNGRVVGMNTAIYSPSGGSVGIGFAIPASTIQTIIADLRATGTVERGWLGIQMQAVDADMAQALGLDAPKGALIAAIDANGPAAAAGFQRGDVILKAGGQDVADSRALARIVGSLDPGSSQTFEVLRDGQMVTLTANLGTRPGAQQASIDPETLSPGGEDALPGLTLGRVESRINGPNGELAVSGVQITDVSPGSDAADKGLRAGDVILSVNNNDVATPADVKAAVDGARASGRRTVMLLVESNGRHRFVALDLGQG